MLEFSSKPKDGSDIHRFSNRKWVSTMCTVGNLWISEASLSKLEKFQHSSALPNIKYNCAVLFLEPIVLCIYLWFKIYFLIDTNTKIWPEIIDLVVFRKKLLKLRQGD